MIAYKKYVTIQDPSQVVLKDLPFRPGQRVEVVLIADEEERSRRAQDLRDLLHKTQSLPQSHALTEDEISAEIDAYRSGQ